MTEPIMRPVIIALTICCLALPCCSDDDGQANGNNEPGNQNNQAARCGNGQVEGVEECDDGTANSDTRPDACRTDCTAARCGDAVVDSDEACDEGPQNSDVVPNTCRSDCRPPRCGDRVVDFLLGETCDCGDASPLREGCTAPNGAPDGECGDTCLARFCGNGVREGDEVCDDGNWVAGDGCSPDCRSDESCGNGLVDAVAGEVCDDGNRRSHDGCSSGCTEERFRWIRWAPDRPASSHFAVAYDAARDRVVMFGGLDAQGAPVAETWEIDRGAWLRVDPAHSPSARYRANLAYDSTRQRTVLFGGVGAGHSSLGDTWEYDGTDWTEIATTPAPTPRADAMMAEDSGRGVTVLYGGMDAIGWPEPTGYTVYGDTWEYDGTGWTERQAGLSPAPRVGAGLAFDPERGVTVLAGGVWMTDNLSATYYEQTWEYDGSSWIQRTDVGTPGPRAQSPLAWDPSRGALILLAGRNGSGPLDDLWRYDGTVWSLLGAGFAISEDARLVTDTARGRPVLVQTGSGPERAAWHLVGLGWEALGPEPSPRFGGAMAWDPRTRSAILYGGLHFSALHGYTWLGDTWRFDGSHWRQLRPASSPGARSLATLVWEAARQRLLLFGGWDDLGQPHADTWVFDGTDWSELSPTHAPPARCRYGAVYDAGRQRVVLFGGRDAAMAPLGDTWVFDGTDWSELSPAHAPSARFAHAMAYDPGQDRVFLFGGEDTAGYPEDTWFFDGTDWVDVTPGFSPPGLYGPAMARIEARDRTLLFGGRDAAGIYNEDLREFDGTEWYGVSVVGVKPEDRNNVALAVDDLGVTLHLFGGYDFSNPEPATHGDTWIGRWTSYWPDEVCDNLTDDDHDGLVACDDPDCAGRACQAGAPGCVAGTCPTP